MKKLISLVLILSMALSLVACGKKVTDTTYKIESNGVVMNITLHAEGDVIKKMTQVSTLPLESYNEDQFALIEAALEESEKMYSEFDCVTYTTDKKDGVLTETIIMDISKEDNLRKLIENKLLPVTNKDAKYLSLKATEKSYDSLGYTKVTE
ncbi:MAG: DUF1307 domain-containing protein [Clostridiales bacterium]|nr:DUF1307 domain-containing protein [Clostridiales bacterium]